MNTEEPRVGYLFIILFILVLLGLVYGIIHYVNTVHIP